MLLLLDDDDDEEINELAEALNVTFDEKVNANGKLLEKILINHDGQVINNNEPTYFQPGSEYKEILDLFICSPLLASTLHSFRVFKDSLLPVVDHEPIEAIFDLTPKKHEDAQPTNKLDYNQADWVKFKNILAGATETESGIDELNKRLTNEILAAADQSIPTITNNNKKFKITTSHPEHDQKTKRNQS